MIVFVARIFPRFGKRERGGFERRAAPCGCPVWGIDGGLFPVLGEGVNFWAKTTEDGKPGISVFEHMVNVGCVARCIAEATPELLKRFNLLSSIVGALVALHDLGKISPGFQRKCEHWLVAHNLGLVARKGAWETGTEPDHGKASHAAVQDFLVELGCARGIAKYVAAALGAHHGRIKFLPNDRGIKPPLIAPIAEERSGIDWGAERLQSAQQVWQFFNAETSLDSLSGDSAAIWWLAGLTSVADWIGSDERYFSPVAVDSGADTVALARHALDSIGFTSPQITTDLTFKQLFGFSPNDMQAKTLATISGPGVYVIEAPMGIGKTEAALGAAYHLLASGKASGIYFALPTQATSNRIHLRMNDFLERISPTTGASRLIHGNSWLMRNDLDYRPASNGNKEQFDQDARNGRDWFASAKRALLAPFGVGTVDQALLGVVAAKHFFVRHFALASKVVILDEVHSYDVYTGVLIDKLIATLEGLGCTVIILSATLTGKRRNQIVSGWDCATETSEQPYPLITGRTERQAFEPVAATPPVSKTVKVDFITPQRALEEAIAVARNGGAVLWICNTVGAAQKQFKQLQDYADDGFKLGLLHSRMIFSHREKREEEWMQRFGKDSVSRCGSILVSTQVVEQSVDLDADLLITEVAPSDMLLQRLGRLWRHEREWRPVDAPRMSILEEDKTLDELREMAPKAIVTALGGKARVYDPYVLLRTLEIWRIQTEIVVPDDIRSFLDATYQEREESENWLKLCDDGYAQTLVYRQKALSSSNIWQAALDDREGVQTRLNEMPTVSLILCHEYSKERAHFIDGASATVTKDEFSYEVARAVHKNLIKVPAHHFTGLPADSVFGQYLYDQHAVGIVTTDGIVTVKGLKDGIRLSYSEVMGLVVKKSE